MLTLTKKELQTKCKTNAVSGRRFLPVRVVKENFLQDGEDGELGEGPVEGGQLGSAGVSSPAGQVVGGHHGGCRNEHLVEQHRLQSAAQLLRVHLGTADRR